MTMKVKVIVIVWSCTSDNDDDDDDDDDGNYDEWLLMTMDKFTTIELMLVMMEIGRQGETPEPFTAVASPQRASAASGSASDWWRQGPPRHTQ